MDLEQKKAQARAAVSALMAISEAIRELGEVPNGVLYAQVMGQMDLDAYKRILGILKGAGVIAEHNHVLRWTGPSFAKAVTP